MTIRDALVAMGYRERAPGIWLKPIGFQAFGYSENHGCWYNWFVSADGKVSLWDSKKFDSNYPLEDLKAAEAYTRTDFHFHCDLSSFELQILAL